MFDFDANKPVKILFIIICALSINFLVRRFIKLPKKIETKRTKTLFFLLQSAISTVIFILTILIILSTLEIDTTPLLASAGILGIAVGFGSQALVKDLIAGLFLLAEDTISVGDLVEIGGNRGIVERISIRTVILRDENGALRIIPAGKISEVVNLSKKGATVNIDLPFKTTVVIDKLLASVKDEVNKFAEDKRYQNMFSKKPELKGIEDIQPGKIYLRVVFYTVASFQWRIKREFLYRIKKRIEKESFELA